MIRFLVKMFSIDDSDAESEATLNQIESDLSLTIDLSTPRILPTPDKCDTGKLSFL